MTAAAPASVFEAAYRAYRMGVKVVRQLADRLAPDGWREWLQELYPRSVDRPFAPHHVQFWEHVWSIDHRSSPRPFFGIWPREGGKSTNVELAAVALGVRGARRYGLYVRRVQDQADNSVQNIAAKLEAATVEVYYPAHAAKLVGKHGNPKGWRRNRIRTAGGVTIDALGVDTASRGLKVEDDRPDFIIFDDIDDEDDTPLQTAKIRRTITRSILPAGSQNCAIIGIQNLILADGIFTTIVDGRADFLSDRLVSGPHPAVRGLEWEWQDDPATGTKAPVITKGTPTWAGQSLEVCQRQMRRWGPAAFLREAQHQVKDRVEGLALNFDPAEHFIDLTQAEVLELVRTGRNFAGIDFQAWRFGWVHFVANEHGVAIRVDEVFSQREELSVRARRIHDHYERLGVVKGSKLLRPCPIWGDSANPQDIIEINAAFLRGWRDDRGRQISSPLRVIGVGAHAKLRRASVMRVNDALARATLRFVRSVGAKDSWLLGYNAGNAGTPIKGSRLIWEVDHWAYDAPPEGKVDLKQDPSDHSADGADLIAAARYALMSFWKPARKNAEELEELDAFSAEALEASVEQVNTIRHRLGGTKKKRSRIRPLGDEDDD